MRSTHQHDPLHRIECWTGKYFCPVGLWEVSIYILIQHYKGISGICDVLEFQCKTLAEIQIGQDCVDQDACCDIETGAVVGLQVGK